MRTDIILPCCLQRLFDSLPPGLHWRLLSDQLRQPGAGKYSSPYHCSFARKSLFFGTTKPAEGFIAKDSSAQKTSRTYAGQRTRRLMVGRHGLGNNSANIPFEGQTKPCSSHCAAAGTSCLPDTMWQQVPLIN